MKKFKDILRNSADIIVLIISTLVYLLFSFVNFVDGSFTFKDFSNYTTVQWVMFALTILLPTFLGVLINMSFRNLAYKAYLSNPLVKEMKEEILKLSLLGQNVKRKLTMEQFIKARNRKDMLIKTLIGLIVSVMSANLLLQLNWNNVVATIFNLLMWLLLGFFNYATVLEYGETDGMEALALELEEARERNKSNGHTKTI
jgi:uncharacterized protein YacL